MPLKTLLISVLLVLSPITNFVASADDHDPAEEAAGKFVILMFMPPDQLEDSLLEISET